MKKTKVRKLNLSRETLRQLVNGELTGIYGARANTVPSCIDTCPSWPGCEPPPLTAKC